MINCKMFFELLQEIDPNGGLAELPDELAAGEGLKFKIYFLIRKNEKFLKGLKKTFKPNSNLIIKHNVKSHNVE